MNASGTSAISMGSPVAKSGGQEVALDGLAGRLRTDHPLLGGVHVRGAGLAVAPLAVQQVHHAQVRQRGDGQVRQLRQRGAGVERRREHAAGLGQQGGARLGPLGRLAGLALAQVEHAGLQQVADAQQHLEDVERLGEKVARPAGQRPLARLRIDVRREHQDGDVVVAVHVLAQLAEDGEPVLVGHVQVQQNQVGAVLVHHGKHLARVRGPGELVVALGAQKALEQVQVGFLVVHQEDGARGEDFIGHGGGLHRGGRSARRIGRVNDTRRAPGPHGTHDPSRQKRKQKQTALAHAEEAEVAEELMERTLFLCYLCFLCVRPCLLGDAHQTLRRRGEISLRASASSA
jgi:hypothetical protein